MKIRLSLVAVLFLLTSLVACSLPEKKQTKTTVDTGQTTGNTAKPEHVLTAKNVYNFLLKKDAKKILFIDVRTPAETERGLPTLVDANVPYTFNRRELNNDFVHSIEERLDEMGLDKQATLLLICHEGNRSARAIDLLLEQGYKNVYSVKGGIVQWKADDLPWSDEPSIEQMYF